MRNYTIKSNIPYNVIIFGLLFCVLFISGCAKERQHKEVYPDLEYDDFGTKVYDTIELSENEVIEMTKTGWIEQDICYRVAIQRSEDVEGEYRHLRDYIFVRNNPVNYIVVNYPSKKDSYDSDRYVKDACDFEVGFEDVNFDGNKDIIISLGKNTVAGISFHCAYIYDGEKYIYNKSFESIPNYKINSEEQCIDGNHGNTIYKYKYENGEFVLFNELEI